MKVAIIGLEKSFFEKEIKKEKKLRLVKSNPDVVLAFGGDGTFLFAEQVFPGIPKVLVKHNSSCKKCNNHKYKIIIDALVNKKFKIVNFMKIQAFVKGKKIVALNDINIHYKPPRAVRINLEVNNKTIAKEVIGDGVIISTPYGSSGYFQSITRKTFKKGIGIAFNNPVKKIKEKVIQQNSVVKVKVVRGPAVMCADCNKKIILLKTGDVVKIKKYNQFAKILEINKIRKVKI